MKHSSIKLADLKTTNDCDIAIEQIERDFQNIVGGYRSWISGRETFLTRAAQKKIDAINAKFWKL